MSREQLPIQSASKTKIIAEIGAASLGIAAAGTVGYLAYRKRQREDKRTLNEDMASKYEERLLALAEVEPNYEQTYGSDTSTDFRKVMAAIAVRVFYNGRAGAEQAATKEQLLKQLREMHDANLHVSETVFDMAITELRKNELLDKRSLLSDPLSDPRNGGFYALPALEWGLVYSDEPHTLLADASEQFVREQL